MAGLPWFKFYADMPTHPKSRTLGCLLNMRDAWAKIVLLWCYTAEHSPDGRFAGACPAKVIEGIVGWRGAPGRFIEAALTAGYLERDGEALVLHGWRDEQEAHFAKMLRDRAKPRGNRKRPPRDMSGTDAGPARNPRGESRELRVERRDIEDPSSVAQEPAPDAPGQKPTSTHDDEPTKSRPGAPASENARASDGSAAPALVLDGGEQPVKRAARRKPNAKPERTEEDQRRLECYRAWRERALLVIGLPADTPNGKEAASYATAYRRWKGPERLTQALDSWDALPATKRPSNLLAALSDAFVQGGIREPVGPAADRTQHRDNSQETREEHAASEQRKMDEYLAARRVRRAELQALRDAHTQRMAAKPAQREPA